MKEDALSQLTSEFKLWGVKFTSRETGGNHIELRWQTSPDKEVRSHVIAKTPGDWRGTLNSRAIIRRMFRADGLTLDKQPCAKPKPLLHKALEIPQPVERDADQIRMLRAEVADLSELVLELASMISTVKDRVVAAPVEMPQLLPQPAPAPEPAQPPAPEPKKPSVRSIKTIDYVSEAWSTTDAIARDMGLPRNVAYMKLYYLSKQNIIEQSGSSWRKKPKPGLVKKTRRLNGHAAI